MRPVSPPTLPPFIWQFIEEHAAALETPYYLIDESRLLRNLERIRRVRETSGARSVLALKCFSTWAVFDLMRDYLDGTTASSPYEARLGFEKFGKEVHAYSVAFSDRDVQDVLPYATKIIFNSISQLTRHRRQTAGASVGLRVNPGFSYSHFDLADPARPQSRLGQADHAELEGVAPLLSGLMFHLNCENHSLDTLRDQLSRIGNDFGSLLERMTWVSLGGGIAFTADDYPLDEFCDLLRTFAETHRVTVYLEPGDAAVSYAGYLVTRVLDVVRNNGNIAVVDAGTEPHMLDALVYRMEARMELPAPGSYRYTVAGRTCLAGDVFGTYDFPTPLQVGSLIPFADAAAYTMVKKNWFNGLAMPSIVVRRRDGRVDVVRRFGYEEYVSSLS